MFEAAEIAHPVDAEAYEEQVPELRERLLRAQRELLENSDRAVIVMIAGLEGAGKGDTANLLSGWLDPRHAWVHGFGPADAHEARFPRYKRFWTALPPRGRAAIFVGSWYTEPILNRIYERAKRRAFEAELVQIRRFEQMLCAEGYVLLKLWLHLSQEQQQKTLDGLHADPKTRWRVTDQDRDLLARYKRVRSTWAHAIRETGSDAAPWTLVPAAAHRHRNLRVGHAVLRALKTPAPAPPLAPTATESTPPPKGPRALDCVDLGQQLSKSDYRKQLAHYQARLALTVRDAAFAHTGLVAVFEGWDAAGKGGAIRRVTAALDARSYRVKPIAAPSDEERALPYLWRFWRHVPPLGKVLIFDRSWYGRVLVERVEGFASAPEYRRAYAEINAFESQLLDQGLRVCKFWLHIDKDEQLRRFEARRDTKFKNHKLTPEDWRNRDKWDAYDQAVHEMVERTSREDAPWTLVPANDKRYARIEVLRTLVDALNF